MSSADTLLRDFADAYERGERPDPGDYLAKTAGRDRFLLKTMIDRYLTYEAPLREYDPEAFRAARTTPLMQRVAAVATDVEAWPALLPRLRRAVRLRRRELSGRLASQLDLAGHEQLVDEAYHDMERGALSDREVSTTVLEALAGILNTSVDRLRRAGAVGGPPPPSTVSALARSPGPAWHALSSLSSGEPEPAQDAEARARVNRLFRGGAGE